MKYVTLGGVGGCRAQCYEALHEGGGRGGGYLADRYVTQIFICLVFSVSTAVATRIRYE